MNWLLPEEDEEDEEEDDAADEVSLPGTPFG